jgi:molecular chaperone DnaK (HSP70)
MNHITADIKFAIIPDWVLDAAVSDRAIRVYCILARYADNETLQAFPSRDTLARRANCNAKAITRAVDELVAIGAVIKEHRKSGDAYQSNLYTLRRVGPNLTLGRDNGDPRVGSDLTPGRVSDDLLTITTELEPKNDNHLTKKPQPKTADDYQPSEAITADFEERYPGLRLDIELEKFRDHHMANGSQFKDWDRAMRKWLRQASEWSKEARAARASMSTDSEWEQWKKENGY